MQVVIEQNGTRTYVKIVFAELVARLNQEFRTLKGET
jgi:hypothetical protein